MSDPPEAGQAATVRVLQVPQFPGSADPGDCPSEPCDTTAPRLCCTRRRCPRVAVIQHGLACVSTQPSGLVARRRAVTGRKVAAKVTTRLGTERAGDRRRAGERESNAVQDYSNPGEFFETRIFGLKSIFND